jgi:hypothetical protein
MAYHVGVIVFLFRWHFVKVIIRENHRIWFVSDRQIIRTARKTHRHQNLRLMPSTTPV